MSQLIAGVRACAAVVVVSCLVCASAGVWAQSKSNQPTDLAAVLGGSVTTRDAATGEQRKLNAAEVEAAAAQRGVHRTADQRRRAAPFNRVLQAMPATAEESLEKAVVTSKGTSRLTSLQEMEVTYGSRDASGAVRATHDPGSTSRSSRDR